MNPNDSVLTLDGILHLLHKHKLKVLCCVIVSLAATTAAILKWPRTYTSDAKLFVRVGRESMAIDPTATTGDTIPVVTSREVEMNTVLGVFRSRVLAEKVVDQLKPETILGRSTASADQPASKLPLVPVLDPITDRERAVAYLQSRCQAALERNSDIITVSCKAKTPALAQRIVAAMVDVYLEEHVRLHRTSDSHTFFATQAGLLEQQLGTALDELRTARNKAGLMSLQGQQKLLQDEMAEVRIALLRTHPALAAAECRATVLRKGLEQVPERITLNAVAGHPNVAADNMRSQLYDLQKREAELAATFVKDYPLLQSIRRQVKALTDIHADQQPQRTQVTTAVNPTRQQLEKDVLTEEATVAALRSQIKTLEEQRAQVHERFQQLNAEEMHVGELERRADLLHAHYRKYAEKLEQGRIDQALASGRITNVNIMQPASFVAEPSSPKKALTLAIGLAVAVLLSFTVAAIAERHERRLAAESAERKSLAAMAVAPVKTPRRPAAPEMERVDRLCEVAGRSGSPPYVGAESSEA
jgi:uncharacterized protein involved in exopolysaccharide biosynthesis